ncbi:MAG TPA: hypothetical protein VF939_08870 [Puia sp.]
MLTLPGATGKLPGLGRLWREIPGWSQEGYIWGEEIALPGIINWLEASGPALESGPQQPSEVIYLRSTISPCPGIHLSYSI